jgi:hypothetical protein
LVTARQQINDPCPHRPAAAAQNAQIGAATSLIALQPTSAQIGGSVRVLLELLADGLGLP